MIIVDELILDYHFSEDAMEYRNLAELFRRQSERFGPRIALRYKKYGIYHDFTWQQYYHSAKACASALIENGVQPGDRVGLLSENRLEWLIADMGMLLAGAVNVPPHAPLTVKQIHFQLADAGVSWLFVSTQAQLDKALSIRAELPELRGIVSFDTAVSADGVTSWERFLQSGRNSARSTNGVNDREKTTEPDSLATIIYTSGTTGSPKGVMLTHHNLLTNAVAVNEASLRPEDSILLSWLPFSHIYARTVDHYLSIVAGITLCLAESADTVVQNLREIQPTHMSCVPRFYEKVLAAVGGENIETTGKKLRYIFGPRIKWCSSGGAPLPLSVAEAFDQAGVLVLQGYGLTESSPVISFNSPDRYKLDTVGPPIPGVEVKIAGDGEVLTRGPHVMPGYWNNDEATKESIQDGWLYTGDIGELDKDGFLKITGRKKELLVLSNGKKVVPPFIEGLLMADHCIDQVVVYGEGRNYLTALVVPQWDNLREALRTDGLPCEKSEDELCKGTEVNNFMQRRVDELLQDVSSSERVKKLLLLPRPFSVEAEELTVSLKLRRNVIFERYVEELEGMY